MSKLLSKSWFSFVSLVLIHAFLFMDIALAGGIEILRYSEADCLSPVVQIDSQLLLHNFQELYADKSVNGQMEKVPDSLNEGNVPKFIDDAPRANFKNFSEKMSFLGFAAAAHAIVAVPFVAFLADKFTDLNVDGYIAGSFAAGILGILVFVIIPNIYKGLKTKLNKYSDRVTSSDTFGYVFSSILGGAVVGISYPILIWLHNIFANADGFGMKFLSGLGFLYTSGIFMFGTLVAVGGAVLLIAELIRPLKVKIKSKKGGKSSLKSITIALLTSTFLLSGISLGWAGEFRNLRDSEEIVGTITSISSQQEAVFSYPVLGVIVFLAVFVLSTVSAFAFTVVHNIWKTIDREDFTFYKKFTIHDRNDGDGYFFDGPVEMMQNFGLLLVAQLFVLMPLVDFVKYHTLDIYPGGRYFVWSLGAALIGDMLVMANVIQMAFEKIRSFFVRRKIALKWTFTSLIAVAYFLLSVGGREKAGTIKEPLTVEVAGTLNAGVGTMDNLVDDSKITVKKEKRPKRKPYPVVSNTQAALFVALLKSVKPEIAKKILSDITVTNYKLLEQSI